MSERRPVVGYEGVYEVSEDGRVFRIVGGKGTFAGKELKPVNNSGYCQVFLSFQKQKRYYYIHRLVASAFLENPENLPMVNHKDSNRQNHHYSNLEWCTQQQNIQHAMENKRYAESGKRKAEKFSKPVIGTHLVTGEQIEFSSTAEAGRNGFASSAVASCCRRLKNHNSHKGYKWRYKNIWQCEWRKTVS